MEPMSETTSVTKSLPPPQYETTDKLVIAVLQGRARLARWLRLGGEYDDACVAECMTARGIANHIERPIESVLRSLKKLLRNGKIRTFKHQRVRAYFFRWIVK